MNFAACSVMKALKKADIYVLNRTGSVKKACELTETNRNQLGKKEVERRCLYHTRKRGSTEVLPLLVEMTSGILQQGNYWQFCM